MKKVNASAITILLVEDSTPDAMLVMEALEESHLINHIVHVVDGVEAMKYLRKEHPYEDVDTPGVILLDLNMPRKDGREVLEEVKTDPCLQRIPVIILTTSNSEIDILKSYTFHANAYIVKPVDFNNFFDVMKQIEKFWFMVAKLPQEEGQ